MDDESAFECPVIPVSCIDTPASARFGFLAFQFAESGQNHVAYVVDDPARARLRGLSHDYTYGKRIHRG